MKRSVFIGCLVLVLLASPFITILMITQLEVFRIEKLEGRRGAFTTLTTSIRTRYRAVTDEAERGRARSILGLSTLSNLSVVRFNGEGIPYFYGWVAYDTGQQQVVKVVVDQLW
jgi:hypothetical protein